jgi:hypothetical protein
MSFYQGIFAQDGIWQLCDAACNDPKSIQERDFVKTVLAGCQNT